MDNWDDRSTFECKTCMFFVPKNESSVGRCRRKAPTNDGWPVIFDTDWCGEHRLVEEQLYVELEFLDDEEFDSDIVEDEDDDED